MRSVLWLLAVGTLGSAAYFFGPARTSYSGHSPAQLEALETEFRRLGPVANRDEKVSMTFVRDERRRRWLWPALALSGVALALLGWRWPRRAAADGESEQRLVSQLGEPELILQGARHKAAQRLGVTLDAPAAVVRAAYEAQLAELAPEKLVGLPEDLRQGQELKRAELGQAFELLTGSKGPGRRSS